MECPNITSYLKKPVLPETIRIGDEDINIRNIPTEEGLLRDSDERDILLLLSFFNIPGGNTGPEVLLREKVLMFQKHFNATFCDSIQTPLLLAEDGVWDAEVQKMIQIYSVYQQDIQITEKETQGGLAGIAENTSSLYEEARLEMRENRDFILSYTGFNTGFGGISLNSSLGSNFSSLDYIQDSIGFDSSASFAAAFNTYYSHRSANLQESLVNAAGENDADSGDNASKNNLRTALMIWIITHESGNYDWVNDKQEGIDTTDVRKDYDNARDRVNKARDTSGRHNVHIETTQGKVNIGTLNTQGNGPTYEEGDVKKVLEVLDFTGSNGYIDFAKEYNRSFFHRPQSSKDSLIANALYIKEMIESGIDIRIGNQEFKNFRLALMIWVLYKNK